MSDRDVVEKLYPPGWEDTPYGQLRAEYERRGAEIERLRAALQALYLYAAPFNDFRPDCRVARQAREVLNRTRTDGQSNSTD